MTETVPCDTALAPGAGIGVEAGIRAERGTPRQAGAGGDEDTLKPSATH